MHLAKQKWRQKSSACDSCDVPEQCTTHTQNNVFTSTGCRQEQWEGSEGGAQLSPQQTISAGVVLSCWTVMKGNDRGGGVVGFGLGNGGGGLGRAGQWRDDSESSAGGAAFNGFSLQRPSSRPPSPGSCSAALLQLSLRNCCRCFCHINLSYPPRKPLSNKTIQRGPQRTENSNTESAKFRGVLLVFCVCVVFFTEWKMVFFRETLFFF